MFKLNGKLALVTGASSGLGAHFAKTLAQAGAHVILAARREDALQDIAAEIRSNGAEATTACLDVTSNDSINAICPLLREVDLLINNAGIVKEAPAIDQSLEDWQQVMETNLQGPFFLAQSVARAMCDHGRGGSIVNIASILGLRQASMVLPYGVSKAGLIQLTKIMALEFARYGIRVNALAPGYLNTELNSEFWETDPGKALIKRIPQRRLGRVEELDGPLLLLASDASTYMTGSVIEVDGGHLVSTL